MDFLGILAQPTTLYPIRLTLKALAVSGGLHLVLGVLIAYYLTSGRGPLRSAVDFLVTLPLVFPPIATGFVLLMLLGRTGWLGRISPMDIIFNFPGVVIPSIVSGLPLMVKPVEAALKGDVKKLAEISQVLGKTDWQTFWLVLLPNIRRNVLAGWFLAIGRSLGEVGVTLMLGGNIIGKTNTLSLEIYNAVFSGEFDRAMVLAVVIGCFSLAVFADLKKLAAV